MRSPMLYPMTVHRIASTVAAVGAVAFCLVPGLAAENEPRDERDAALIERLIDAWKEREASVESASFQWQGKRLITAKMQQYYALVHRSGPPPPDDTLHVQGYRLAYDSAQMRYDISPKISWSSRQQKYVNSPFLSAFDGQVAKLYRPNNAMGYPAGTIFRERQHQDIDNTTLIPILLALRPFGYGNPTVAFSPDDIRRHATVEDLPEGPRIRLRRHHIGDRVVEAWVDPEADFRLINFTLSSGGRIGSQCRIRYEGAKESFIPSGWTLERFARGEQLFSLYEVQMTKAELNPRLPPETFTIEFPVGTYVRDLREDRRYIVREGGAIREVLPSERRHLSYDVIVETEPGEGLTQGRRRPTGTTMFWWAGTTLILLMILAISGAAKRGYCGKQ